MRLIDADNFLQSQIKRCRCVPLIGGCSKDNENLKEILAGQPTVDPVHAAGGCYCRECKYHGAADGPMRQCDITDDNDFCSHSERRGGKIDERNG